MGTVTRGYNWQRDWKIHSPTVAWKYSSRSLLFGTISVYKYGIWDLAAWARGLVVQFKRYQIIKNIAEYREISIEC